MSQEAGVGVDVIRTGSPGRRVQLQETMQQINGAPCSTASYTITAVSTNNSLCTRKTD